MKKSFLPALLLMFAVAADVQEFRATISGHVYDQTRAAVPKARVEATNIATNETATVTTDASDSYSIPALRPGQYNVTVTATGFKSTRRENLALEVGRVVGVDVNLEVGEVSESVTVIAEGVALETQTASRVGVVTTTQVSELPLNSRNPFMLGSMMSGVNFPWCGDLAAPVRQRGDRRVVRKWRPPVEQRIPDGRAAKQRADGLKQYRLRAARRFRAGVQCSAELLRRAVRQDRRRVQRDSEERIRTRQRIHPPIGRTIVRTSPASNSTGRSSSPSS